MSKNLTRKGLALGAIVALASTVIAGSPAFAAGEITLAPQAGTSLNIAIGSQFTLATTFGAGFTPSAYSQLKYLVKTDANSTVKFFAAAAASSGTTDRAAALAAVTAGLVAVGNTPQAVSTTSAATSAAVATATEIGYLGLVAQTTAVTSNVEVTAFVDANNDGALTAGEWNTVKTVSFKKAADIVPVVSLTAPATGDTSLKATVVWGDLNIEQMADETVKFTAGAQFSTATAGTLADGVWTKSATALVAADVVTAQAYNGATALGVAASVATSARTISQPTAAVVAGANGLASGVARTNSAFAVAATVKDTATVAVVKAGVTLKAAITVTGTLPLSATKTLSINGTVYNGTVALPASVDVVSDAAGLATVNLVTVGFVAADAVSVVFTAQNLTPVTVAVDLQDALYTVKSTAVGSPLRSIVEGGSTTLNFVVKDQFGVVIGSGARLEFVVGYTGTTATTSYVAVAAGAASITVTDTTANIVSPIPVDAYLQTQNVANSNWTRAQDLTPADIKATQQAVYVSAIATTFDTVPAAQSIALSTSEALTTASVTNPGAPVTIASKGVTFTLGDVDYVDTITLFAGNNGDIVVYAKSDIAGAHTITYTAGSETKTSVVTVAAAASNSGATLAIDAPASILPGRTLEVTVSLVDKFGNPVVVANAGGATPTATIVYNGPGLTVGTITQTLDASGKSKFRVLMGANELGSATITATYDADGNSTTTTATVLTATKTVAIAAAAVVAPKAAVIASKNGRVYVTVNSAAGFKAYVKVGFSTKPSFTTTGSKLVSYFVGADKRVAVRVYVRGGLVASQAITVK